MFRAKNTFFIPGGRVRKGDLFADGDPILVGREAMFEQVDAPEPKMAVAPKVPARKAAAKKPAG